MYYDKLDFEIRLVVFNEYLSDKEEKQLIKNLDKEGWSFEGRMYYEDKHSIEYRFAKYYNEEMENYDI